MKKIFIMLLALGLVTAADAQKGRGGGGRGGFYRGGGTRVIVSAGALNPYYYGYGVGSPYFGMGMGMGYGFGYGYPQPFYNGYNRYSPRPTQLEMQVEDLKHEYQQKINAARDDDSISGKERRATVKQLKHDRDEAISQAKRDFYRQK